MHVPEEELLPGLEKQAPLRAAKVARCEFLVGKRRKNATARLLMLFTLVLFVVVGLTAHEWWQNHKAQQDHDNGRQARLN